VGCDVSIYYLTNASISNADYMASYDYVDIGYVARRGLDINLPFEDRSRSRSRSYFTTDGQSVCLGVEPAPGLVIRYYFLSEGCCLVSVGRPL
jgi:hypothetical protein